MECSRRLRYRPAAPIARFTLASVCARYKNEAMSEPDFDLIPLMTDLTSGRKFLKDVDAPIVDQITSRLKLRRDQFQALLDNNLERAKKAPAVGDAAPDFDLELVDGKGVRTGDTRQLSACLGKPIALIFGSYT